MKAMVNLNRDSHRSEIVRSESVRGARLLILLMIMSASRALAVDALSGGNVNLINTLYSTSNLSLDLTANGTNATLATFIINNNAANSFTFAVTLVNGGEFIKSGEADGSGVKLTGCNFNPGSTGTLGAGLTALVPGSTGDRTSDLKGATAGQAVLTAWSPGAQTTATTNYALQVRGTWTGASLIEGLYTETIRATLTANL
jgi:hypothetical protein